MNSQINQLVKSLLKKDSIDQCSVQELQQYAERHPYFGAAQLLFAKKLQSENNEQFNEQLQKTLLYFHNPLWVEQLLNDNGNGQAIPANKAATSYETTVQKEESTALIEDKIELSETAANGITEVLPVPAVETPITEPPVQEEIKKEETATVATTPKEELLFEPFHTVDYFASQGIKFKEDEKPKDKFGLQLRSFTEWLKTMKKLPVTEIVAKVDGGSEKKVEQMAEKSLQEGDVMTEAMAEVWEKQGNMQKAIDIYSKLSLLEPSKSAYFAAKIEELKKKN